MRILVIDDDATFCRCLAEALTRQGHAVEWVNDGLIGFERCLRKSYDAVICDVRMPLINGTELVCELRRDRPNQPVILISAFADEHLAAQARQSGARLLSKPFDPAILEKTLSEAVADYCGGQPQSPDEHDAPAATTDRG
jgi:DNA-binding response OmpR family regulator